MSKTKFSRPVQDAIDAIAYKMVVEDIGRQIEAEFPELHGFRDAIVKSITPAQKRVFEHLVRRVEEIRRAITRDFATELQARKNEACSAET